MEPRLETWTKRMRDRLARVFLNFDLDGNGCLDAKEIAFMLTQLSELRRRHQGIDAETIDEKAAAANEKSAAQILQILDADKNGTVEDNEFVDFVIEKLTDRRINKARGAIRKSNDPITMVRFFILMEFVLEYHVKPRYDV